MYSSYIVSQTMNQNVIGSSKTSLITTRYTHPYNGNYCLFYVCYTNFVFNSLRFSAYVIKLVLKYYVQIKELLNLKH